MFGYFPYLCNLQKTIWIFFFFLFFVKSFPVAREFKVNIFPSDIKLYEGSQQMLLISKHSDSGFIDDLSRNASLTTSNPAVAIVQNGIIRAVGEATLSGVIVDCDLKTGLSNHVESYIFGGQLKNTF